MENIKNFIPVISYTAILPLLLLQFKAAIDAITMSPVEKIFFTNSKKISIYFSILFSTSLIAGSILFIQLNFIEQVPEITKEPITSAIGILIMFFVTISTSFFILLGIINLLSVKMAFYILDTEKKEKWYIIKPISNSKLLLSKDGNEYSFMNSEALMEKVIIKEINTRKDIPLQSFIYKNKDTINIILLVLIVITTVAILFIVNLSLTWRVTIFSIICLEYLVFVYTLIANNNSRTLEKYIKK